jgi:hypothetical protein
MDTRNISLLPPRERDADCTAGGALDEPIFDDAVAEILE